MSGQVLFNLLNGLVKTINVKLAKHFIDFYYNLNKFNNTGA